MASLSGTEGARQKGWLSGSQTGRIAIYLAFAAVAARTLSFEGVKPRLPEYLGLELVYVILFSAMFLAPRLPDWLKHLYFVAQSVLVLGLLSLEPEFDFVVVLFFLLSYQASLFFQGRMSWIWVGILVFLTGGSLIYHLGFLRGLALAPTTMAAEIIFPAYMHVNQESEAAQAESQVMLGALQATHQQLEVYAGQVEELAAIQERNRLARELHDSVSQLIFSISLTTRAAQMLLEKDPQRVGALIGRLQETTTEALTRLRSLITELRPPVPF